VYDLFAMHSIPADPLPPSPHKARPRAAASPAYRAGVAARAIAAIGGGYLLAALSTRALALALPLSPIDKVVAATLTGLVVYPCAIMWCFAAASAARAWLGLAGACALVTIVLLVLTQITGPALGGAA
jgi:hypothetical protein